MFEKLSKISVNEHTEDKNGLTYLSWVWAWSKIKEECPDANYEIKKFENNLPYVYDENTGYMVFTSMTIDNLTYEMWLPVMDSNNKAMLNHSYTYKVKEYKDGRATGNYIDKTVEKATMFDINKTIMRCLVKNIAMFGLGIYIYAGEDLPVGYEMSKEEAENVVVNFGQYKGKTLKEVKEIKPSYIEFILGYEKASESLKNACSMLVEQHEDISLELIKLKEKAERLIIEKNVDREEIINAYKKINPNIKELSDLSKAQFEQIIERLEKK